MADRGDEAWGEPPNPPRSAVIGFWWRLLSDTLDAAILAVFGFGLFSIRKDFFYALGDRGWWIGLLVAAAYAGILQAGIGGGQTLAKRLLRLQVRKVNGDLLSFSESLLRYSVIMFIVYGGSISAGLTAAFPVLTTPGFVVSWQLLSVVLLCGVVLLVPFHPLKQGLHDLLVGSVVVRKGAFDLSRLAALRNPVRARRALAITGFACLALLLLGYLTGRIVTGWVGESSMARLEHIRDTVEAQTRFQHVQVSVTQFTTSRATTRTLTVGGFLLKHDFENAPLLAGEVKKAADLARAGMQDGNNYDAIVVRPRTGFNMGIASLSWSQAFRFSASGGPRDAEKAPAT